jgi:hypothetical protein
MGQRRRASGRVASELKGFQLNDPLSRHCKGQGEIYPQKCLLQKGIEELLNLY